MSLNWKSGESFYKWTKKAEYTRLMAAFFDDNAVDFGERFIQDRYISCFWYIFVDLMLSVLGLPQLLIAILRLQIVLMVLSVNCMHFSRNSPGQKKIFGSASAKFFDAP